MGPARLAWDEIPLARETDTMKIDFAMGPLFEPTCVNMGNPHAVFFVEDADAVDLPYWGPQVEKNAMFPERVNASVGTVKGDTIRLRVWERGAGITDACGTAACASVVAASRLGLIDRSITVALFPERVNASVGTVKGDTIRLRVWERGAGITDACGTAACASVVAASRLGLIDRKATVMLDGGPLEVEWLADGTVQMTGAATLAFKGEVAL